MPRPRTPDDIVRQIENIWAENGQPSADLVFQLAKTQIDDCPKLRKIQQILREARSRGRPVPAEVPLVPWDGNWPENPNDIDCLLRLGGYAKEMGWPGFLTPRRARWAIRLRRLYDVVGLDEIGVSDRQFVHIFFAGLYARRERAADILGRESPYTEDLDGLLMFRVWESDLRYQTWIQAVDRGVVPPWQMSNETKVAEEFHQGSGEYYQQKWDRLIHRIGEGQDARDTEATE